MGSLCCCTQLCFSLETNLKKRIVAADRMISCLSVFPFSNNKSRKFFDLGQAAFHSVEVEREKEARWTFARLRHRRSYSAVKLRPIRCRAETAGGPNRRHGQSCRSQSRVLAIAAQKYKTQQGCDSSAQSMETLLGSCPEAAMSQGNMNLFLTHIKSECRN